MRAHRLLVAALAVAWALPANAGEVHFRHWGINQKDETVFEGERRVLIKRRIN